MIIKKALHIIYAIVTDNDCVKAHRFKLLTSLKLFDGKKKIKLQ